MAVQRHKLVARKRLAEQAYSITRASFARLQLLCDSEYTAARTHLVIQQEMLQIKARLERIAVVLGIGPQEDPILEG